MTSAKAIEKLKEETTCHICLELMTEPRSISCGHIYCLGCILTFTENQEQETQSQRFFNCPMCLLPFQVESLRPVTQLQSLIEVIKDMERNKLCALHGEQLHLFCEDDKQLICWRCERTPQHRGHVAEPVEDVCQGYLEKFQEAVTRLRQLEDQCVSLKIFTREQITIWEEKIKLQKEKIQSDFRNLYVFLREEEKSYLWRLETEKEKTLRRLMENEAKLQEQSLYLRNHIQELKRKCQGSAQDLLQDVNDTLSRSSAVNLELPETISLELQTLCNVSELYFNMRKVLKHHQVRLTLDPLTAHKDLFVTQDLRTVMRGCSQKQHDNSKRFTLLPCVLSCEAIVSGRHYFEVDIGNGTGCEVGVCLEKVMRGINIQLKPQSGFWAIRLCKGSGSLALTYPPKSLLLNKKLRVVGVFLDFEAGFVSFYDMNAGSHIFTFPRASFSDILKPFFSIFQDSPLSLSPQDE